MTTTLTSPDVDDLGKVLGVLGAWQTDDAPFQLHPGDIGWFWRFGADATANAVRTWTRDEDILAIGLLDGPDLLRLALRPDAQRDDELARQIVADLSTPDRGVLPQGEAYVETPLGALANDLLGEQGWAAGEPWTMLRRDLTDPVADVALRLEVVGPERAQEWGTVHRSAFKGSLSDEVMVARWTAMASGPAYADARTLLGYDAHDHPVAAVTVWSAGAGRCGLIEPMGAHADYRGHGHGTAITVAAAGALRELGASAVLVATPSANIGGVATYAAAGFHALPERRDRHRTAG